MSIPDGIRGMGYDVDDMKYAASKIVKCKRCSFRTLYYGGSSTEDLLLLTEHSKLHELQELNKILGEKK